MKRSIMVSAVMGGGGDQLKILSVHEAQDKLIVIANFIESQSLFSSASITEIKDEVMVNTSSNANFPITYYLTGLTNEDFENIFKKSPYKTPQKYLSDFHTPTEFVYLSAKESINDLLTSSRCLYEHGAPQKLATTNLSIFSHNRVDTMSDANPSCQIDDLKDTCRLS